MKPFAAYLHRQYVEWCAACGERRTLTQFAERLHVHKATLNQWMQGRALPRLEFVEQLAQTLGLDVYDALEIPRPDPILFSLIAAWGRLPSASKKSIAIILEAAKARDTGATT